MPQNVSIPAVSHALTQIVVHEGPVGDDDLGGRPYFRHEPGGSPQWTLIYTRAGAGLWEYPGWTHVTRRGEAVLMRAGAPRFYRRVGPKRLWNQMWVQFHPRPHWHAWLTWPEVAPGVMHLRVNGPVERRAIEGLLRACVAWANKPSPHWQDHAQAAFEHVLLAFEAVNPRSARHNLDPRLLQAMEYLSQHLGEPVMLPDVARAAGVSASVLSGLFHDQLATTPMRYLEEARLQRAMGLLLQTPLPIRQVAEMVGFDDPFYFSRRFTARLRVNPRRFRRQLAAAGAFEAAVSAGSAPVAPAVRPGSARRRSVAGILAPGTPLIAYHRRLIDGMLDGLGRAGWASLVVSPLAAEAGAGPVDHLAPLVRGDLGGILSLDAGAADEARRRRQAARRLADCPVVTVLQATAEYSSVTVADAAGAAAAARALIALGHRHLLHLAFLPADPPSDGVERDPRRLAIAAALRDAGLDPATHLHRYLGPGAWLSPKFASERLAARRSNPDEAAFVGWLRERPAITAILAGNDAMAIRAYAALRRAGLEVPGRYSLVGFDDTDPIPGPNGANLLSSVAAPLEEVGRAAVGLLLRRRRTAKPRHRVLPTRFVARASIAPPGALRTRARSGGVP